MGNWNNPIILDFAQYMGLDPISAIKKECNYLLNITENTSIPVNIDRISKHLGLKKANYLYGNLGAKAYLEKISDNNIKIRLNEEAPNYYRYRFSIAHEIGHIVIRNKINKKFLKKEKKAIDKYHFEEELLCQFAASELLLPEFLFKPFIVKENIRPILVTTLSKKFQVSIMSVLNRISYLLPNYVSIYWKNRSTKRDIHKDLRVSWIFPKPQLKNVPFIPIQATAKERRFDPNLFLKSFKEKRNIAGKVNVENFGSIYGEIIVCIINPIAENTLFRFEDKMNSKTDFDLYSIIKYK